MQLPKMGRRPCAVLNCVDENRIRHRFPNPDKFPDRYQKWLFLCGNKKLFEKDPELVYRSLRVCHAHFKPEDRTTNMFIRKDCLPELFLPPPLQLTLVAKPSVEEDRKDSTATGLSERLLDEFNPQTLMDENFEVNLESFEPEPVKSEGSEMEVTLLCDKDLDTVENANNSSSVDYVMSTPLEKPYFRSIKNFVIDRRVTTEVCRICLRSLAEQEIVKISKGTNSNLTNIEHMLKTVLPDLDLKVCSNNVICLQCSDLVNHSFNLKTLWLSTKQKLEKIMESKKNEYNPAADLIIVTKSEVEKGSEETIIRIEHDHAYEKQAQTLPVVLVSNGNEKISYNTKTKKITRKSQWGSGPCICEICGALYHQMSGFRRHMWNHKHKNTTKRKQEQKMCELCGQLCFNNYSFKTHMMEKHKEHKCTICEKVFATTAKLKRHVDELHLRLFLCQCHYCGKQFSSASSLRLHMLIHNPKKHYECHRCDKKFLLPTRLRKHVRTHVDIEPVKCNYCNKRFKYESSMKTHVEIWHLNQGKYECNVCGKLYWKNYDLKRHKVKIHGIH